jgi:hypothetical protein
MDGVTPAAVRLPLGVFFFALAVRLAHNAYALQLPIYQIPLGFHAQSLVLAERILAGDILPFDRAVSINTPLMPYLLAAQMWLFGETNLFAVRLCGAIADACVCACVAFLARRWYGVAAGLASGIIASLYGPMVLHSIEATEVPYGLLAVVVCVALVDRAQRPLRVVTSGLLAGVAALLRPDIVLLLPLLAVEFLLRKPRAIRSAAAFLAGAGLVLSALPAVNYRLSGDFVPLTLSGGHNFYLGHGPRAGAGYNFSGSQHGDIFDDMKRLAEEAAGRCMSDPEVSRFYLAKAFSHIATDPGREVRLLFAKLRAFFSDYEYDTYVNYDFAREYSPLMRWTLSFGFLLSLAALGYASGGLRYLLVAPAVPAVATGIG